MTGDRDVEEIDFPGVLKKKHVKILGVYEKLMWSFHGSWLLTLEFSSGCFTQLSRIRRGERLFSKGKIKNLKITEVKGFKKVYISSKPLFGIFLE